MDKFPGWATATFGGSNKSQVSHGLNLALPLENPIKLPLLLWDIMAAQPKISRALEELSFVHYARFVPSWDGTALMVTTEFDGPLEPYVMDFVIALGDVFDVLLGYVDPGARPTLPIRDHPEEFWSFIQLWNRVPFAPPLPNREAVLFPPDFDFPLYSAYPSKTVTDIAGKRTEFLHPVIDHPAAPVDLKDVQGNILNGYRADRATHLFFSVVDAAAARNWLASGFPAVKATGTSGGATVSVTSAVRWIKPPTIMLNVAFTYAGFARLLPKRVADLNLFPTAFCEGAEARAGLNGDVGPSDPSKWLFGRDDQGIHVVVSIYMKQTSQKRRLQKPSAVESLLESIQQSGDANGLRLVGHHTAQSLPDGREHFGYKDGISKPRISGQCKPDEPDFQPAASPGEFLLGKAYKSIFGGSSLGNLPEDLANNGTFGALRLLEQDVDAFNRAIADAVQTTGLSEEMLKAKLLGRWPDGQALALDTVSPSGEPARNDFDYAPSWEYPNVVNDHEGERCPVGAHVRRTNPRSARVAGQRHARRLIRRGMPSSWKDPQTGTTKVGLLGLFIGASLERQFEFIQREWIQGDLAASGIRGSQDPIAGLRTEPTELRLSATTKVQVPPLVTTRGSLYLFFPSLSTLRGLDKAATPSVQISTEEAGDQATAAAEMKMAQALNDVRSAGFGTLPDFIRRFLNDLTFEQAIDNSTVRTVVEHFATRPRARFAPLDRKLWADFSPLDPGFMANPYPTFKRLRATKPVVWVPGHDAYWVLRRNDADDVLSRHADFVQQPSDKELRGILTMDEPRHGQTVGAIRDAFAEATRNQARWTDEAATVALERLKDLGQFDLVSEFSAAVPKDIYWRIFGLPRADVAACDLLAQTMMRHFGQPPRPGINDSIVFADAAVRLTGKLGRILAEEWLKSLVGLQSEGLIGELAKKTAVLKIQTGPLTFLESLMTLVQLALVHMSAQFLLGTAARNLLTPGLHSAAGHKTPWARLADLSRTSRTQLEEAIVVALNEARRVDAPVTIVERFAARDLTIGGIPVQKDCPVFVVVASANRDFDKKQAPEEFIWDRAGGPTHLSLGHGIHLCAGRDLQAKLVPQALTRLIEALPDLRLTNSIAVPAWYDNVYFRALQSLPVTRCP